MTREAEQPTQADGVCRDKKRRDLAWLYPTLIGGLFTVLAAIAGAVCTWFAPTANAPPPSPVVPAVRNEAPPPVEVLLAESPISHQQWQATAADLSLPIERKKKFFSDYLGKQVTWDGIASHVVDLRGKQPSSSAFILVMYDTRESLSRSIVGNELGIPCTRCHFSANAAQQLLSLGRGARVVIKGTIADRLMSGSLLGTDLYECQLVLPHATRTAKTARISSDPRTR